MTALLRKRPSLTVKRACQMLGIARSTWYYEARPRARAPADPEVHRAILELAVERPSFGYRRMTAMVCRRLGRPVNEKKVRRIMRAEHLLLHPCVQPRYRVPRHPGRLLTEAPDLAYQADMKYIDCGRDGWGYLQNVVECCTSDWLGYRFNKRCGAREANEMLDRVVQERFPTTCLAPGTRLRVDNGPCYRADAFTAHAEALGFLVEHIQVQTPEDNGIVESFHAGLDRDDLGQLVFDSFEEARAFLEKAWVDYNTVKPMKRLGWKMPREYRESFPKKVVQEVVANVK